ncbi:hypothetical protein EMMF5_004630 [Cystobasidiomycetes sp. EMM_F5]
MGKIVHIVMMVRNEGTSDAKVEEWASEGLKMKDKIPGIDTLKLGPCLPSMQHRTKFTHSTRQDIFTHPILIVFHLVLYAIFESEEALKVYQTHEVHVTFQKIGVNAFHDKTVFDLEL